MGCLLMLEFSMVLACSSSVTGARGDAGTVADGGGGSGGSGGAGGATSDARFACGDASCSVAQEYCRDLTNGPGGAPGANDGGPSGPVHDVSCVPFGACAAHDCSCVPQSGGYFCGACSQQDGGGSFAICGQI